MTQEGGFNTNPTSTYAEMNVDASTSSRDLKPSPELFGMIQAAASSLTGFAQLWESIRKKGNSEGFSDLQLQWLLRPLLKDKLGMSKDKIYYLFHKEEKAEQNKQAYDNRVGLIRQIDKKNVLSRPEEEIKLVSPKEINELADTIKNQKIDPVTEPEEPTDLELLQIENQQLKDALHKTEQFKPANKLTEEQARDITMEAVKQSGLAVPQTNVESVTEWLKKQADGAHSFYYDTYGIDLFTNRILSQLKNSGVKVFKRLYFEV